MKLVGNKKTIPMVEGFFGIKDKFVEVAEGDVLELGATSLQFFMVPMVHWPETMVSYMKEDKILFSGDAFGSFGTLDGGIFDRSEEHTSELQSRPHLVCRLLLEKKKKKKH